MSVITKWVYLGNKDVLNCIRAIRWSTPDLELGIGDIFMARNNSNSNSGRHKFEAPLFTAIDDADFRAQETPKLRVAIGTGVQRSSGCECEESEGEGESGHGRKHYDEEDKEIFSKGDTWRS